MTHKKTNAPITVEYKFVQSVFDLGGLSSIHAKLEWSLARDNVGDPAARALDAFVRMSY